MILDSGVFIALEDPADRRVVLELMRIARRNHEPIATNELVLAQA